MKKYYILILITICSLLAISQDLTQDTINFKSGYSKPCLIVGDSEDHIYAKFVSMDLNPGDTVTMQFKKDAILVTNNPKYSREYFDVYLKQRIVLDAMSKGLITEELNDEINLSDFKSLAIATHDQRDMVVDGSQKECFLGYGYADIGIAYPINTKPKEKVSNLCTDIVSEILNANKIQSDKIETSANCNKIAIIEQLKTSETQGYLIITLQNLRSDCRGGGISFTMNTLCAYTIKLDVYNKEEEHLLHKEVTSMETFVHGKSYKKHIRNNTTKLLEAQLTRLLNEAGIINSL